MKRYLERLGISNLWLEQNISAETITLVKQRIRDNYIQNWHAVIDSSPRLDYYRKFKTTFELESYLLNIQNDKLRKQLTLFRISGHMSFPKSYYK